MGEEASGATIEDLERLDIRAGTVVRCEPFPEARKPAYKLWIDFGDGRRREGLQRRHHRPVRTGRARGPSGARAWSTSRPGRSARSARRCSHWACTRRTTWWSWWARTPGSERGPAGLMRTSEFSIDTRGRQVVEVTERVVAFAREIGGDGLLSVFVPHATCGLALIETGAGSEEDSDRGDRASPPRDDRYDHQHGPTGHGADHLLPALDPLVPGPPGSRWRGGAGHLATGGRGGHQPGEQHPLGPAVVPDRLTRENGPGSAGPAAQGSPLSLRYIQRTERSRKGKPPGTAGRKASGLTLSERKAAELPKGRSLLGLRGYGTRALGGCSCSGQVSAEVVSRPLRCSSRPSSFLCWSRRVRPSRPMPPRRASAP